MYKEIFPIRIKQIRKEIGLTQEKVSDETGINRAKISKYENGSLEPNLEILGKLADYYEISTDWLLGIGHKKRGE